MEKRRVKTDGFIETQNAIQRNICVTFLATDTSVTMDSARKHVMRLEEVVDDSDLKLEVNVISDLLNGKLGKMRQLIGRLGYSVNSSKIVETINAYQMVMEYKERVNQETLFHHVMALARHILSEITQGGDDECDKIEGILREQICVGIYDTSWLEQKVASLKEGVN